MRRPAAAATIEDLIYVRLGEPRLTSYVSLAHARGFHGSPKRASQIGYHAANGSRCYIRLSIAPATKERDNCS
jgi:hypothetical protein